MEEEITVPAEEWELRVQALMAGFRETGLRLTHQRLEIIREIAGNDSHPDVETLYRGVRRRVPTVSLDTVYRMVSSLTERGLIDRVTGVPAPARYDGNPFPHHHFICNRCSRVIDIHDPGLDAMALQSQAEAPGDVQSIQIQFRGTCETCRQAPATAQEDAHRVRGKRG